MAEGKYSFVLYCDQIEIFEQLTLEQRGELITIIFDYVNDRYEDEDDIDIPDPFIKMAFTLIKLTLKRDLKKYEKSKKEKSKGAKMGNIKRWYPELYLKVQNKEISEEEAITIMESTTQKEDIQTVEEPPKDPPPSAPKKKLELFIRPKLTDVQAYCKERKNNVNPIKFYNFYESKGWVVGKTKMKDWKACVHTWEEDKKIPQDKIPASNR